MTNSEKEKTVDQARSEQAKNVRDGFDNKTLPHPDSVNAVGAFRKQWQKKLDDKLNLIECRENSGHYNGNPADFKKDWDDAYYARFIIHLDADDWKEYLK